MAKKKRIKKRVIPLKTLQKALKGLNAYVKRRGGKGL